MYLFGNNGRHGSRQVKVVAFDGMPAGLQAIKDGEIFADPIQHPDKIGRECVKAIIDYLSGIEPKANISASRRSKASNGLMNPLRDASR